MLKNILLGVFAIFILASCSQQATSNSAVSTNQFGEAINAKGSISYDDLLNKLSAVDSVNTKVKGTVSAVCKKKGCWMTIVSEGSDQEMRVKFKDYGFFMPMDIEGKTVIFEGKAYKEMTSVADLQHYAEDAGKTKEEIAAITEPQADYNFLASGVLLLD